MMIMTTTIRDTCLCPTEIYTIFCRSREQ